MLCYDLYWFCSKWSASSALKLRNQTWKTLSCWNLCRKEWKQLIAFYRRLKDHILFHFALCSYIKLPFRFHVDFQYEFLRKIYHQKLSSKTFSVLAFDWSIGSFQDAEKPKKLQADRTSSITSECQNIQCIFISITLIIKK